MQDEITANLPPLNALRAFETAARHLSFTRAAQELCVTPGAVSRQVKQLEEILRVRLFHRLHRQLVLTAQGEMLKEPLRDAFYLMATALDRLKNQPSDLKIKVHPTFAIRWLIPKLHRFQTRHADIQVRLTTSSVNVDFTRENFDVGITYRGKAVSGVTRTKILGEFMTPVCSPRLLEGSCPLKTPEDLKHHLLLHNNPELTDWRAWAVKMGLEHLSFDRGQIFEVDDAALQAAVSGLGVALGNLSLIGDDLEAGRLIIPYADMVAETGAYYIVRPVASDNASAVSAFIDWIIRESGLVS